MRAISKEIRIPFCNFCEKDKTIIVISDGSALHHGICLSCAQEAVILMGNKSKLQKNQEKK